MMLGDLTNIRKCFILWVHLVEDFVLLEVNKEADACSI
jgi:hypothetical protein